MDQQSINNWEGWLTKTLFTFGYRNLANNCKGKKETYKVCDLELEKVNLIVDIMSGVFKHAILVGKWGSVLNLNNQKKIKFMDQILASQNTVFKTFGMLDGFCEVSKLLDLFIETHRFYLYDFFGNQWDNELLCNAVLRYYPFVFNLHKRKSKIGNVDEIIVQKKIFFQLKNKINETFEKEISLDILPDEKKFINFILNFIDSMKDFNVKGIILFIRYFEIWKKPYIKKKHEETYGDTSVSFQESIFCDFDYDIQCSVPFSYYSYLHQEDDSETFSLPVKVDKRKIWKKVSETLTNLEEDIIKLKFKNCLSFEEISKKMGITVELCKIYYNSAIEKLRESFIYDKSFTH